MALQFHCHFISVQSHSKKFILRCCLLLPPVVVFFFFFSSFLHSSQTKRICLHEFQPCTIETSKPSTAVLFISQPAGRSGGKQATIQEAQECMLEPSPDSGVRERLSFGQHCETRVNKVESQKHTDKNNNNKTDRVRAKAAPQDKNHEEVNVRGRHQWRETIESGETNETNEGMFRGKQGWKGWQEWLKSGNIVIPRGIDIAIIITIKSVFFVIKKRVRTHSKMVRKQSDPKWTMMERGPWSCEELEKIQTREGEGGIWPGDAEGTHDGRMN